MIVIKLSGGLGNQMFQYALGRHLAIKNKTELKLDIGGFAEYKLREYSLKHFKINEAIASPMESSIFMLPEDNFICGLKKDILSKFCNTMPLQYVKQAGYGFQKDILDIKNNSYVDGTWQSENYFLDISSIIKNDFTLKEPLTRYYSKFEESIKQSLSVCIHFRRGDYVTNPVANHMLGLCSLDYYLSAIRYVESRLKSPHFFIFSDDPLFVKEKISIKFPVTIVSTDSRTSIDYQELYLMSLCKHQIIANSTFSWWAAWLNDNEEKIVIAPKKWFNDPKINAVDLIPNTWITM